MLDQDIINSNKLQRIINEYGHNQFNPEYNLQNELESIDSLPNIKECFNQIEHFRWGTHKLIVNNLCTDFDTNSTCTNIDATTFLTMNVNKCLERWIMMQIMMGSQITFHRKQR